MKMLYTSYSVNVSITLEHHVKPKQCMKPLGIHHHLLQLLAVLLLYLNPQLSGSSSGLLFPWYLGTSFFNCDSTTMTLIFILTAD